MRIAVLTSGTGPSPGWHVRDLQRAAAAVGVELALRSWRDLAGDVGAGGAVARSGPVVLDDAGVLLLRTMPAGSLEQIVFRMDLLSRAAGRGLRAINRPRAVEIAVDKYLALARIADAGLPVPPTVVCQRFDEAMDAFTRLGGDVVVKPLFGSEGFGMTRLTDAGLAERTFVHLERLNAVIYLQQFVPHDGSDLRLLVLAGRVLASMKRTSSDWRTNVSRGGVGEPYEPTDAQRDMALRAAAACEADVAGVDILIGRDARPYVLEVNAVPGWRELSRVTNIDVAEAVLRYAAGQP